MLAGAGRPDGFVEALAKGLAVLECFDATHSEMTLSEIARRVDVTPAAARRSLITLMELGYVGQAGKRFHLKPRIMALGSGFYYAARVDELLQPHLRRIVEAFGDASSVGTLDGQDVIYIAHVSVQRARRASAMAGARYPALRHLHRAGDPRRVCPTTGWTRGLPTFGPVALTSRTCVDKARLREEILTAREQGYATTVDQLDYGITALAVPIRNAEGRTVAALNSSGYTGMVTPDALVAERLPELAGGRQPHRP